MSRHRRRSRRAAQWAFDLGIAREKPNLSTLVDLTVLKKLQAAK